MMVQFAKMLYYNCLFVLLFVNRVFGQDCETYNFEDAFDERFSSNHCPGTWELKKYSEVGIEEKPNDRSTVFIAPGTEMSCTSSYIFPMHKGGVLTLDVYYDKTDIEVLKVIVYQKETAEDVADKIVGIKEIDDNSIGGQNYLEIELAGSESYEGYFTIFGRTALVTSVYVDSFKYESPSLHSEECAPYYDMEEDDDSVETPEPVEPSPTPETPTPTPETPTLEPPTPTPETPTPETPTPETPTPETPTPETPTPTPETPTPETPPPTQEPPTPETPTPTLEPPTPTPETPTPETPTPETPTPETPTPETLTPTPETPTPTLEPPTPTPETPTPETPTPETPTPETPTPETPTPETPTPETPTPETQTPETPTQEPPTPTPETPTPETPTPETPTPETPTPETPIPETPTPETPTPETPTQEPPTPTPTPETPTPETPTPETPTPTPETPTPTLEPPTPTPETPTPTPETPTPETPTPETPTQEPPTPTPETPTPETPTPETPTPETPTPETPTPETPTPETPTPETPTPETPTPETPTPETPTPETMTQETPTQETPTQETPTPTPETPIPETPTPETPTPETSSPTPETPTPTPTLTPEPVETTPANEDGSEEGDDDFQNCVTNNFEDSFEGVFGSTGICGRVRSEPFNRRPYSSLGLDGPHPSSTVYISPAQRMSCTASSPFTMHANGVLQLNVYLRTSTFSDQLQIMAYNRISTTQDQIVGTFITDPRSHFGWNEFNITLTGDESYEGYVAFMGMASVRSTLLIDSFRYIPPHSVNESSCVVYEEAPALPTTTDTPTTTVEGEDGPGCLIYRFEQDYNNRFTRDGVCRFANSWLLRYYSTLRVGSPHEESVSCIVPSTGASCTSSFVFPMAEGGVIEVKVYAEPATLSDLLEVFVYRINEHGSNSVVGTGNTSGQFGWITMKIYLAGNGEYDGQVTIMARSSIRSFFLVDSFRYIPPSVDEKTCPTYTSESD